MLPSEVPTPADNAKPAYRDSNVLRWLTAYTVSAIGDSIYFLSLGWAASEITGPTQVGLVLSAGTVPRAVLMLGGGLISDRFGLRTVVIVSDTVRCLTILGVAASLALTSPGVWLLLTMALVFGVVDAIFVPAVSAIPPHITEAAQLVRLQGMYALAMRLGGTLGPPGAGLAMAASGPAAAFTLAGALFAVSLAFLAKVRLITRPATTARSGAVQDLADGLRYIRRHALIGPLVASSLLVTIGASGPLNLGLVLLAGERGWGASGVGWIVGAFSVGAGAGAMLLTVVGRLPRAGIVQIVALAIGSGAIACLTGAAALPAAAGLGAVSGVVFGVSGGLTSACVQAAAEPAFLGRVMSVISLATFGLGPLTYVAFGAAVAVWGTGPVFLASAAMTALGAAVRLVSPAVRRAELPQRLEPARSNDSKALTSGGSRE